MTHLNALSRETFSSDNGWDEDLKLSGTLTCSAPFGDALSVWNIVYVNMPLRLGN